MNNRNRNNRQNNRRVTNNNRRRRRGANNNSQQPGRGNTAVVHRTFTSNEILELNNSNGANTIGNHRLYWDAQEFEGFAHVASTYDQYRCVRVQVFATPTMGNPNWDPPSSANETISNLAKVMAKLSINSAPSTTVYSAIDYNYDTSPGVDIFSFNNLRNFTLDPFRPVKIADFQPQLSIDATTTSAGTYRGELNLTKDTWINTKSAEYVFHGIVIRMVNSNAVAVYSDISSSDDFQRVNFRTVATFAFKGPNYKSLPASTNLTTDQALIDVKRR